MGFRKGEDLGLDLSDFRIIWVGDTPFIIPNDTPEQHVKYLVASQMTLMLGNKSVDYVLKTYMDDDTDGEVENPIEDKLNIIDEVLSFAKVQNRTLRERLKNIYWEPETLSSLTNEGVFLRLEATVKSIHYHIKFGFYYESFALIRLLIEQLAFAYNVSRTSTESVEDFLKPTKAMTSLSKFLPGVGKMYSSLSDISHIDKSTIGKYLGKDKGRLISIIHSTKFSLEAVETYLTVLKYQNIVFEYCFRDYIKTFEYINDNGGEFTINSILPCDKSRKELIDKVAMRLLFKLCHARG